MTLLCLDLTASRARAVCGPMGSPRPVMLDDRERELPLALSLEGKYPAVGCAGMALCRRLPHLACLDFLPYLGKARTWGAGRQRLNAGKALSVALEHIRPLCAHVGGLALVLPGYLSRPQVGELAGIVGQSRLPPLAGSVAAPLAAAWAAHGQNPWCGLALVLDADLHALTWTALAADEPDAPRQVRTVGQQTVPQLGVASWKERVLDGVADRCIRQSRRDPRESAAAEQAIWDQLDTAFDAAARGQNIELAIQSAHWYQHLILAPSDLALFCKRPLQRVVRSMHDLLGAVQADGPPAVVLVTAVAARLPGLLGCLEENTAEQTALTPLSADNVLKAAHQLACQWLAQAAPCGHHDVALKLNARAPARRAGDVSAPVPAATKSNTKLPAKKSKLLAPDDDFSLKIDE
jgi:hypothetical protein